MKDRGDIRIASSHEEADRISHEAAMAMTPEERLRVLCYLRWLAYGEGPPRLERILTVAPLHQENDDADLSD